MCSLAPDLCTGEIVDVDKSFHGETAYTDAENDSKYAGTAFGTPPRVGPNATADGLHVS